MCAVQANNACGVQGPGQVGRTLGLGGRGGFTAVRWACIYGREHSGKALLDGKYEGGGAEVDALTEGGYTPLMWASMRGHEGIMRLLLARGAKVATRSKYGDTALSLAMERGHPACAALLRAYGATS